MNFQALLKSAAQKIAPQEARWLLSHVTDLSPAALIAKGEEVPHEALQKDFWDLINRRVLGEPLAYLMGKASFLGEDFFVSPAVLIPRPETELLVHLSVEALKKMGEKTPWRVLELGTGSGIIAISIKKRCPLARFIASDISQAALGIAKQNAAHHQTPIDFVCGNWFAPVEGQHFHAMIANPPYVAKDDPHLQQNGLPFEPSIALSDGACGAGGLAALFYIIDEAPKYLEKGGFLHLEHGYDQAAAVRKAFVKRGFSKVQSWQDEAAIWRVSGGVFEA